MKSNIEIRDICVEDAQDIADIYNYYIENTTITFEEDQVSGRDFEARIRESNDQSLPWLVLCSNGVLKGYAYASKWKGRCAYRYSVEITVYLANDTRGQAYGSRLYDALFKRLRGASYHSVIAGISLPNDGSVALHEKFGLTKAGHFKEVGYKFNQWVDVGYWQDQL